MNNKEVYDACNAGAVTASIDPRPEVAEFAAAMELKLRKNDHKTGWKDQPIEAHIKLLRIEMMELDVALDHLGDEEAMRECVDIANFAMIIRDKLKARIEIKPKSTLDNYFDMCNAYAPDGDWTKT